MPPHTVIFIGRSGCGKGTQAALFMERVNKLDIDKRKILYIETGKRFREFIRGNDYSSKLSKVMYEGDERQPDFLACFMWGSALIEELGENMHLVFDGVARAINEAEVLTTAMKFYKRKNPTVIHLNVSRKWAEDKLLGRGRTDDRTIQKIDKRLNWFDTDASQAIEYFKESSEYRYIELNGEQSIEKVFEDLIVEYDKA